MQRCANSYSGDYREDRVRLPRSRRSSGALLGGLSGAPLGGLGLPKLQVSEILFGLLIIFE